MIFLQEDYNKIIHVQSWCPARQSKSSMSGSQTALLDITKKVRNMMYTFHI